jgi:hypothetical protein
MFKGSLLLLPDSCTTPWPTKLHALTHPPSLLADQERLWTFDLDKSQVYKEEPLSAILCLHVCLAGVSAYLHPLDQEKLPGQDFLSLVCLFSAPEGYQFQQCWNYISISHSVQKAIQNGSQTLRQNQKLWNYWGKTLEDIHMSKGLFLKQLQKFRK